MNPEVKKRWVEALRSGDYEQGEQHLRVSGKYCCLGVLCEISDFEYDGAEAFPPPAVVLWADLGHEAPSVLVEGARYYLSNLNDDGMTFEAIAKLIEEQL